MSSPTSAKIDELISSVSDKVEIAEVPQAVSVSEKKTISLGFQMASDYIAKYEMHLIIGYILIAIVGAYMFVKNQEEKNSKDTSKKVEVNRMKVLMWTIVFNLPLIVWKAVSIKRNKE